MSAEKAENLVEREAEQLRQIAYELGDMLKEKCLAYGTAHNRQAAIWEALLAQYEEDRGDVAGYWIPKSLVYQIPRLTRVFDRVLRIVSNPAGDRMSESPWRDLAGDALAGVQMPQWRSYEPEIESTPGVEYRPNAASTILAGHICGESTLGGACELPPGHDGHHRTFNATGPVPRLDVRIFDGGDGAGFPADR